MFRQASIILCQILSIRLINYLTTSFVAIVAINQLRNIQGKFPSNCLPFSNPLKTETIHSSFATAGREAGNNDIDEARHLAWPLPCFFRNRFGCFLRCSSKSASSCRLLSKSGGLPTSADLGYRSRYRTASLQASFPKSFLLEAFWSLVIVWSASCSFRLPAHWIQTWEEYLHDYFLPTFKSFARVRPCVQVRKFVCVREKEKQREKGRESERGRYVDR